jgi:hypothetical protein
MQFLALWGYNWTPEHNSSYCIVHSTLFIYGLFNDDAVSSSGCVASNSAIISDQLNGKLMDGNVHGLTWGTTLVKI